MSAIPVSFVLKQTRLSNLIKTSLLEAYIKYVRGGSEGFTNFSEMILQPRRP